MASIKKFYRTRGDLDPWRDWRRLLRLFGSLLLVSLALAYLGLGYLNNLATTRANPTDHPDQVSLEAKVKIIGEAAAVLRERATTYQQWRESPPRTIDPGRSGL